MANITHLPEEILLQIVQEFKPKDENYLTNLEWLRRQSNWWNLPHPLADNASEDEDIEWHDCYSTLFSLSYTNRCFYRLCTPLIYSKVDLFSLQDYHVAMSKKQYVQCLRIRIRVAGGALHKLDASMDLYQVFSVLGACTKINSLVIFYESGYHEPSGARTPAPSLPFTSKVVSLLESGQLKTLAIFASNMGMAVEEENIGPLSLFSEMRTQVRNLRPDQQIHIVADRSIMPRYSEKQMHGGSHLAPAINKNTRVYFPPPNLVSLKFMSSGDIHAPHLPDLVLHCPQLRYLFVSECGDYIGLRHIPRPSGWSTRSDALWRQREPLEEFHIEHMLEWEILAMGTIPARTVIMTSLVKDDLQKSFLADPEMFPGVTLLRYESRDDMPSGGEPMQKKFEATLKQRKVRWSTDAVYLHRRRWRFDGSDWY
ncbi:hypothetical protein FRC17_010652 [Serendipita sp. 399]|nr:hypothetical protein FRC17_010652 [Serendipita sp. 399]